MDKRLKIALIGLAVMLITSLLFSFITLMSKTKISNDLVSLSQMKEKLEKENKDLTTQLSRLLDEKNAVSGRLSKLEKEIESAVKERDMLQNKYSLVQKEKESLITKLQELSAKPAAVSLIPEKKEEPAEVKVILPEGMDDTYWGSVLRENAELKIKASELENQLVSIKSARSELETEKSALRDEMKNITEQRDELVKKINDKEKVAQELSVSLAKGEREKRDLKTQINNIEKEKLDLEAQILKLQEQMSAPTLSIKTHSTAADKKATVELSPIIVRPPQEKTIEKTKENKVIEEPAAEETKKLSEKESEKKPEVVKELSGKILNIDKENNFVIIDIGEENGIELNRYFDVYRGKKKIGRIQVVKMRENVSACDILSSAKEIKVGDIVK